ncbi:MAG: hypothetical protein PHC52_00545 [Syntrophales bacterium]|nr:hypothetical protein [Syntrophales bacterium]
MSAPEKIFAVKLGDSPTGKYLDSISERIGKAGPIAFQVGAVVKAVGLYLEHKIDVRELSAILLQAGMTLDRFDSEPGAEKKVPSIGG